jgi:threonine/homoserine/homoserine lactone efflux protein
MVGDPEPEAGGTGAVPRGTGLAVRLRRAWATERGRRRIVVSAGIAISVIGIAVAVSLFASLAGESQAFRDGYSAGGSAYTAYAAYSNTDITAEQACHDEEAGPGGRPVHDDPDQWVKGCMAAFNLARSDN